MDNSVLEPGSSGRMRAALMALIVWAVAAYLPAAADGLSDASFGQAGVAKIAFPNSTDGPLQAAAIVNGQLNVAGFTPSNLIGPLNTPAPLYLAQVSPTGVVSGAQVIKQQALQNPTGIVVRPDGNIIAEGVNFDPNGLAHGTVVWFDSTGQVIASYMRPAAALNDQSACFSSHGKLTLDRHGNVLATCLYGMLYHDENEDIYSVELVRLVPASGALSVDSSFGTNGWETVPTPEACLQLTARGDVFADAGSGYYYFGGTCNETAAPSVEQPFVARLDAVTGAADPTYGAGGIVIAPVDGYATLFALDSAQRIIVAGPIHSSRSSTCCQFISGGTFVARLSADGTIDPTFGNGGVFSAQWLGPTVDILPDATGRIYVLASQLYRLAGSGLDPTFSSSSDIQSIDGAGAMWGSMLFSDSADSGIYLVGGAFAAKSATNGVMQKITLAGGPAITPTQITLTAAANQTALTLTATVTGNNPSGAVTFFDGNAIIGSSPLTNGTTALSTFVNLAGPYNMTAYYGGDAANGFSTSATVPITLTLTPGFRPPSGPSSAGNGGTSSGVSGSVGQVHTSGGGDMSALDLAVLALLVLGYASRRGFEREAL